MSRTQSVAQVARGFAMGAADIVPGVSGGTVALVTGIYERLIANVHEGASILKALVTGKPKQALEHLKAIEWTWIIPLGLGLLLAVASLASVIEHQLEENPQEMAGLFFGLVLGSAVVAWRLLNGVASVELAFMSATAVIMFFVLGLTTSTTDHGAEQEMITEPYWMFFLAGSLAICAMILPGISGSFILVMLGMYPEVLGAVNDRDLTALLVFMAGAVVGLALFSTLLNYLLERYRNRMLAVMIGLMVGSLRVLWPWPDGTESTVLGAPSDPIATPIGLAVVGFAIVLAVELVSTRMIGHEADTGAGESETETADA